MAKTTTTEMIRLAGVGLVLAFAVPADAASVAIGHESALTSKTLVSNGLASNRLASNRLASNRLASNRLASNKLSVNRLASNKLSVNRLASNKLAGNRLASNKLAGNRLLLASGMQAGEGAVLDVVGVKLRSGKGFTR